MKRIILSLALATLMLAVPNATAAPAPTKATTCFSPALWSAPAHLLPCHSVERPQEDGSGRLTLRVAGKRTVCRIPNPTEERRTFTIKCRRVAR